jgi:trehalose 6-phosphate phosphatase
MQYLLSKDCLPVLTGLAQERTLCAFDFDGTLAPIVLHPDQAAMSVQTETLLCRLAELYPCIVVSGRARVDVLSKLRCAHLEAVIGNHGAEGEATLSAERERVQAWAEAVAKEIKPLPGAWVENKGLSLAVHYRQAKSKVKARRLALEAARKLEGAFVLPGKQVINVIPQNAPNKGDAVENERKRLNCSRVLFAGDDDNDEDVFALGNGTIGVRIGRKKDSKAGYYLHSQAEIDSLLETLIALRSNA